MGCSFQPSIYLDIAGSVVEKNQVRLKYLCKVSLLMNCLVLCIKYSSVVVRTVVCAIELLLHNSFVLLVTVFRLMKQHGRCLALVKVT